MRASKRTSKPAAKHAPRKRGACSPHLASREPPTSAKPQTSDAVLVEPPTADGVAVTVRVIPLPDHESNPLRARQLAVIVDLLRRAAEMTAGGVDDRYPE